MVFPRVGGPSSRRVFTPAEKMARLYDEIVMHADNVMETEEDVHHLNVFFSRLLFCFFAEERR